MYPYLGHGSKKPSLIYTNPQFTSNENLPEAYRAQPPEAYQDQLPEDVSPIDLRAVEESVSEVNAGLSIQDPEALPQFSYIQEEEASYSRVNDLQSPSKGVIYQLTLKIHYETKFGEYLCVTGNTSELGNWKQFKLKLKWTEGHIWTTPEPIRTRRAHFMYKYVVLHKEDEPKKWENGLNRVVDLRRLSELKHKAGLPMANRVELIDNWNQFCIKFKVFHPSITSSADRFYLCGLGTEERVLLTPEKEEGWQQDKYGREVRPMIGSFLFCNGDLTFQKDFSTGSKYLELSYYYLRETETGQEVREREIRSNFLRQIVIQDPHNYSGHFGDDPAFFRDEPEVFIVNGYAEKLDGNFLPPFKPRRLGDSGVVIGQFIQEEEEVIALKKMGVTAVLCLQTKEEQQQLTIEWNNLLQYFYGNGMTLAKNLQINEIDDEADQVRNIFQASQYLNDMINNKNHRVFVYCTSGITRSATVVAAYLALYKKVKCWEYPQLIEGVVQSYYPEAFPNLALLNKTIARNRDFQEKQVEDMVLSQMEISFDLSEAEEEKHERKKVFEEKRVEIQKIYERKQHEKQLLNEAITKEIERRKQIDNERIRVRTLILDEQTNRREEKDSSLRQKRDKKDQEKERVRLEQDEAKRKRRQREDEEEAAFRQKEDDEELKKREEKDRVEMKRRVEEDMKLKQQFEDEDTQENEYRLLKDSEIQKLRERLGIDASDLQVQFFDNGVKPHQYSQLSKNRLSSPSRITEGSAETPRVPMMEPQPLPQKQPLLTSFENSSVVYAEPSQVGTPRLLIEEDPKVKSIEVVISDYPKSLKAPRGGKSGGKTGSNEKKSLGLSGKQGSSGEKEEMPFEREMAKTLFSHDASPIRLRGSDPSKPLDIHFQESRIEQMSRESDEVSELTNDLPNLPAPLIAGPSRGSKKPARHAMISPRLRASEVLGKSLKQSPHLRHSQVQPKPSEKGIATARGIIPERTINLALAKKMMMARLDTSSAMFSDLEGESIQIMSPMNTTMQEEPWTNKPRAPPGFSIL